MLSTRHTWYASANAPKFTRKRIVLSILTIFASSTWYSSVHAEEETSIDLAPIAITGNPMGVGSDELVTPVSVLNGRELSLRRESTLGEMLNGIPGVSSTQFGPNSSRPVIRGLDAERVKMMQNGTSIVDASSLSFDHAVGIDPLIIEQVDVVRGPAALLYGGSAIGGVVNAVDHRIPTESIEGIIGRAEARFGGPENQRNGAAVIDLGNGNVAVHIDAYKRKTDDLDIPGFAVSRRKQVEDGTFRENKGKLINSASEADGGAIGASWTFDNGHLGISYSDLNNTYGVVAEQGVTIDMDSQRWDLSGEITDLNGPFHRYKVRMSHTDYEHKELEGSTVGTTFKNRGMSGTVEAGHQPIAGLNGIVGYQFQNTQFQAIGEEAFVPNVTTKSNALYVYEELPIDAHKLTFGSRFGKTSVDSQTSDHFGPRQSNDFNTNSFALGGLYNIDPRWSIATNLSHNERAPSYFELYANGAHVATGQFEIGNSTFNKERSNGIDAQLRWKSGKNAFNIGVYATRFKNFIGLFNTGNTVLVDGLPLPEARFQQVRALFKGIEFEGKYQLYNALSFNYKGDYTHAKNTENNDYLPRISPLRLGAGLDYQRGAFNAKLEVLHAFKQNNTAANELKTSAYTDMSAMIAYKLPGKYHVELFAKANNLLDEEIRQHSSFLKDISPAGERSILFGAKADF